MSRHTGRRTPPTRGFSRGMPIPADVPIVGQRQGPPEGEYVFWVACFLKRAGEPLDAHGFRFSTFTPNPDIDNIGVGCGQIAEAMQKAYPDRPRPSFIPINWKLIEFTPQVVVEKRQQFDAAMGELAAADEDLQRRRIENPNADTSVFDAAKARAITLAEELGLKLEDAPAGGEPGAAEGPSKLVTP